MKKVLPILALAFLCSCQKDEPLVPGGEVGYEKGLSLNPSMDVHILAGQSNCTGQGNINDLPTNLRGPIRNALVYNETTGTLDTLKAGVNNEGGGCMANPLTTHGPEIAYMHRLTSLSRRPTLLVKKAFNASLIYHTIPGSPNLWERPDQIGICNPQLSWNINIDSALYDQLVTKCQAAATAARNANKTPVFKTLVFYQGESDARYLQRANAWSQNVRAMFDQLKLDLNSPDMKLIIIRSGHGVAEFPYISVIRHGQDVLGTEAWCETVNVDGIIPAGILHANSAMLRTIGIMAANARLTMP